MILPGDDPGAEDGSSRVIILKTSVTVLPVLFLRPSAWVLGTRTISTRIIDGGVHTAGTLAAGYRVNPAS